LKDQLDHADVVLKEIEAIGQRSFIPSIGPVKGRILAEILKKPRPEPNQGYESVVLAMA
jgi:hypothetical protein